MKKLKKDLQAVSKEFKALTKRTKELTTKLKKTAAGQLEKAQAAIKLKSPAQHTAEALKVLTKQTGKLIKAVEKFEKDKAAKKAKAKAKPARKAAAKKAPAKKKAAAQTATDQVVNIIKRSKKGVDVPMLIKKTGFEDKKIRNIVFKASKAGEIKRAGRGGYVAA
jgi:septal ring factor EnvC (AmiA/AmiB activator)